MNILIFYRHFPVAMGRYIKLGLEQAGHKVWSCGVDYGSKIPWGNGMDFPEHHYPPNIGLEMTKDYEAREVVEAARQAGFKADLLIEASDTTSLSGPAPIKSILIGTDPHAISYGNSLQNVNRYVSMQKYYMTGYPPSSVWMPYGYLEGLHRYLPEEEIRYNVVFSGLQYPHRIQALKAIADKGWRVFCGLGYVYEDYVKLYNQGMIAFNWSSKEDLPARFWEGLAMKRCVLTNRVPDLKEFNFVEGVDYLGFSTLEEAVDKADYYLKRPELLFKIADNGYKKVQGHNWKNRVTKMLEDIE